MSDDLKPRYSTKRMHDEIKKAEERGRQYAAEDLAKISRIKLQRTLQQYANGVPEVIADGSRAQVIHCIADAKKDIATLARHLDLLSIAAKSVLPENFCLTNSNIPDDTVIPLDLTMGELRALHRAIIGSAS